MMTTSTKLKLLWYLLLSAIGVFHAEVLSWSSPDVLYNPSKFLLVTPVYAVHYILFGDLIIRHRRQSFAVVYLLGCLTGMYETIITKVYFSPPWNPTGVGPLGIAWLELLWIGFTWHAFMSFLIPLRLTFGLIAPGASDSLRSRTLRATLLVAPAISAIIGYGFGMTLEVMLPSVLVSFLVLAVLILAFVRGARRWGFTSLDQVALGRRGRWTALVLFAAVYGGYGLLLRPEAFPVGLALVPVILLYAGLIYLAFRALSQGAMEPTVTGEPPYLRRAFGYLTLYLTSFVGFFLALGALALVLPGLLALAAAAVVYAGAILPGILLPWTAAKTLRPGRMEVGLAEGL